MGPLPAVVRSAVKSVMRSAVISILCCTAVCAQMPEQAGVVTGKAGESATTVEVQRTTATPMPSSGAAGVIGLVVDATGALIPGAAVHLAVAGNAREREVTSDAEGGFRFVDVPPAVCVLAVSAPGFQPFTSAEILLHSGTVEGPVAIRLTAAGSHAEVVVNESRRERADVELHAAERQRVLGIFPNFYTSYVADAAPLDAREKFSLALHATTDPTAFFTAGAVAGGEQIKKTFPAYGSGAEGFGKRYGAAYADGFAGKMIGSALLPSVFHQDPRYFSLGTGGFRSRLLHVAASAVTARGDNGRMQPNYSHILGNAAAGALSTLYHPSADSAGRLALDNALLGTVGEAAVNFAREFLLRPFTRGVPAWAVSKP